MNRFLANALEWGVKILHIDGIFHFCSWIIISSLYWNAVFKCCCVILSAMLECDCFLLNPDIISYIDKKKCVLAKFRITTHTAKKTVSYNPFFYKNLRLPIYHLYCLYFCLSPNPNLQRGQLLKDVKVQFLLYAPILYHSDHEAFLSTYHLVNKNDLNSFK